MIHIIWSPSCSFLFCVVNVTSIFSLPFPLVPLQAALRSGVDARQSDAAARGQVDLNEVLAAVPLHRLGEEAALVVVEARVAAERRLVRVQHDAVLARLLGADAVV